MAKDDVTLEISIYSGRGGEQLSKSTIKDMAEITKHPGLSHLAGAGFGEVGVHFPRAMSVAEGADALFDKMGSLVKGKSKESPSVSEIAASFNTLAKDLILTRSMSGAKGREGQYNFQLRTRGKGAGVSAIPFAIKSAPEVPKAPKAAEVFGHDSDIFRGATSHQNINYRGFNLVRGSGTDDLVLFASNAKNPGAVRGVLPKGTPPDPPIRHSNVFGPGSGFEASVQVPGFTHLARPVGHYGSPSLVSRTSRIFAGGTGSIPKYGLDETLNYNMFVPAPEHLEFQQGALARQQEIARAQYRTNMAGAPLNQLSLFGTDPIHLAATAPVNSKFSVPGSTRFFAAKGFEDIRFKNRGYTRSGASMEDSGGVPSKVRGPSWGPSWSRESTTLQKQAYLSQEREKGIYGQEAAGKMMFSASSELAPSASGWFKSFVDLFTKKPAEGSSIDTINKMAKGKAGGGGGSDLLAGTSTRVHGGDIPAATAPAGKAKTTRGGQFAEQFRHAAIWSAYSPFLGGALWASQKMMFGDPYTEKAAHSLIGVGLGQKERDAAKKWAVETSILNPYTTPQQHLGAFKEIVSGSGLDPYSGNNMYYMKKSAEAVHQYSEYMMEDPNKASRALSRQAQMMQKISAKEAGKSSPQILAELASLYASMGKSGSITGQELQHSMALFGPSALSSKGLNWSKEQTAAFISYFVESGMREEGLTTAAKHLGSGVPISEQMARREMFMDKLRKNIDEKGPYRASVPNELLNRGYYEGATALKKHPQDVYEYQNKITKFDRLLKSGDQAVVLNELQTHAEEVVYLSGLGPKVKHYVNQSDMPFWQMLAGMKRGQPAAEIEEKLQKIKEEPNEIWRGQERARADTQRSAGWSAVYNWVADSLANPEQASVWSPSTWFNYPVQVVDKWRRGDLYGKQQEIIMSRYKEAVAAGDTEAASRWMASLTNSSYSYASAAGSDTNVVNDWKRQAYFTGVEAKAGELAAKSSTGKVKLVDLPQSMRDKLSSDELSRIPSQLYNALSGKIEGLPYVDPITRWASDKKKEFELPADESTGLPTNRSVLGALRQLPPEMAKALAPLINALEIKVSSSGDGSTTVHTNRSTSGIPPEPANAAPAGYFRWGQGAPYVKF